MGFKVIKTKCPVCAKPFLAESFQMHRAQSQGRLPACSRSCEQERRHAASRDRKWLQQQARILTQSPNNVARESV